MNYILWLVPPVFILGTTYWFNRRKPVIINRDFWITFGLDAIMAYTLSSTLLIRLVNRSAWLLFLYLTLFFVSSILRFWHGNVRSQDLDLEIETLKNNLVTFGTTFVPFLLIAHWLDELNAWIRYPLAIVLAIVVFGLSLPIKWLVSKLTSYFYKQSQLVSDLTVTIVFYVISSSALVILLVITLTSMYYVPSYSLDLGSPILPDSLIEGVSIDWNNATIVDVDVSRSNRMILLLKEDDGDEYLIRYFFSDTEDDYGEVLKLDHDGPSVLSNDPYIARFGTSYIDFMTPTEGLYIFTTNDISLVPESEGISVHFINYGPCQGCFLADNGDGTFDLWNSVFQVIDTIPSAPSGSSYTIINRYLFQDDGTTYTMVDDDTIVFTKQDGVPTYDPEKNILYTVLTEGDTVQMTLQHPNEDVWEHTFDVDEGQFHLPLFDTYIYDPVELFATHYKTKYSTGLYIHSHQNEQGEVFSLLSYDPDQYVAVPNLIRSRVAILERSDNRNTPVLRQASMSLLVEVDDNITTRVVRLISILSAMLLFIPITNYTNQTTVVDFDNAMKQTNKPPVK